MSRYLLDTDWVVDILNGQEHAIETVLERGQVLTPDLGGKAKTEDLGRAIAEQVLRHR